MSRKWKAICCARPQSCIKRLQGAGLSGCLPGTRGICDLPCPHLPTLLYTKYRILVEFVTQRPLTPTKLQRRWGCFKPVCQISLEITLAKRNREYFPMQQRPPLRLNG